MAEARRNVWVVALWAMAACGGRTTASAPAVPPVIALADSAAPVALAADTVPDLADSAAADSIVTPEQADSLADELALAALEELEFGSLDRGAPNVKGSLPAR